MVSKLGYEEHDTNRCGNKKKTEMLAESLTDHLKVGVYPLADENKHKKENQAGHGPGYGERKALCDQFPKTLEEKKCDQTSNHFGKVPRFSAPRKWRVWYTDLGESLFAPVIPLRAIALTEFN
jgi:hypothetical protein